MENLEKVENSEEKVKKHGKTRDFLDFLTSPAVATAFCTDLFTGLNPNTYYKHVRKGATVKEAILAIVDYKVMKAAGNSNNLVEEKLREEIKLSIARRRNFNHDLMEKELKVVAIADLQEVFEPIFSQINSGLIGIARKYPDTKDDVTKLLKQWEVLGEELQLEADEEVSTYVDKLMNEELDYDVNVEAGLVEPLEQEDE